jgi:hypothetical protein
MFGAFELRGTYDAGTNELNVTRAYLPKPVRADRRPRPAAATPVAAPDKPPPRIRRTPSHLADSQLELGSSLAAHPVVDLSVVSQVVGVIVASHVGGRADRVRGRWRSWWPAT